ncbi:toprim domain-containing protein [Providencia stuartii]|nr:toprim domain-containing protein [Providencia stuartii]
MKPIDIIREVKLKANGQWQNILSNLGVEVPLNTHTACPACGGKDRFRFDDKDGNGTFICNQCGAGDGLDLVQKILGGSVTEAAQEVASIIGIDTRSDNPPTYSSDEVKAQQEAQRAQQSQNQANEKIEKHKRFTERYSRTIAHVKRGESDYIKAKGFQGVEMNLLPDGSLIIPLLDGNGTITAAQTIKPNGEKRLLLDSSKNGSYYPINEPINVHTVIIAEGLATAMTCHLIQPEAYTVAAIDAGNLIHVAKVMRTKYPESKIIIAGDNDSKNEVNTGKVKAETAAREVNGYVSIPPNGGDWNDYLQYRDRNATASAFIEGLYQPQGDEAMSESNTVIINTAKAKKKKRSIDTDTDIAKLAPNQLAMLLIERYGQLAVNTEALTVYTYNGVTWEPIKDSELSREMADFFIENETHFSMRRITGVIDVLKVIAEPMGESDIDLIGFTNGVLNTKTHEFRPHNANDWLLHQNGITYTEPTAGENLKDNAPNFTAWLSHVSGGDEAKARRIKAGLYMVFANRYDWQLFIEATGVGGSGKSVFAHIAELLAGKHNTSSGDLKALDDARGRAQFVGKKLILLPDQPKYVGDGAGLKAITGGDPVGIDPKYEKQFSMVMKSVVFMTGNRPMQFTERSNGVGCRRVIFHFNETVSESKKDKNLPEKIQAEIPVIIRDLLREFPDPETANRLLIEQRGSNEAVDVKRETDPLIDFCAYLVALDCPEGMYMGNANISPQSPRKYLYHAYMAYMQGNGNKNPLTLTTFGRSIDSALKELGKKYIKHRFTHGVRTNLELNEFEAEDWLPRTPIK